MKAALLTSLLLTVSCFATEPLAPRLGTTPVVVELFTSQGCSSCPPADALITAMAHDASLRDRVIPLAYHVDYWDRLGWRDPFSSRLWTQRQMVYVRQMRLASAYTPQVVVGGQRQFTGSRADVLEQSIVAASHARSAGAIAVEAKRDGNSIVTTVRGIAPPDSDLVVALVEYDVTTSVKAGENEGRTIVNDAIVRSLARVTAGRTTLKADPAWQHLAVVAFVQDRETLAITNAAVARLYQ